jgi:DNA-binding IclR family transcriptional regulator
MKYDTPIKATQTTFAIIEKLTEQDGMRLSELASLLNLPKSTVHDHLATLDKLGYLSRDGDTYRVGTRFLRIGTQIQDNMELYQSSKPELNKLSNAVGEHTSLMIEENGLGVYVHTSESANTVKVISTNGTATKLHITAPGKAILAHLPAARREEILDSQGLSASTTNTLVDREELEMELESIRERGYAFDREEAVIGMRGVAAPVITRNDGAIRGAISVYGPSKRTDIEEFENEVVDELLRTVNVVEVNMSY